MNSASIGARLDRIILKRGFHAGWPLLALGLIEARRILSAPLDYLKHRLDAATVLRSSPWARLLPRETGVHRFAPDAFPELGAIVAACEAVYARHAEEVKHEEKYNKRYFFNLLTREDLHQHPVLLDFALSAAMSEAATGYLGSLPRLHSLGVFYSSVNDTIEGSQMYHVDGDALAQMKCFVNVWDVSAGSGALAALYKSDTSTRMRSDGLLKVMSDADIFREVPEERKIVVAGKPGSGVLVDTSRCMHQGSRAREKPRLVFQFQYVTRPDALLPRAPGKTVPGGHLHVTRDLIEGIPLHNKNALRFVG